MRISNLVGQDRISIDELEEGPTAPLGGMLTVGGCLDSYISQRRANSPSTRPATTGAAAPNRVPKEPQNRE